LINKKKKHTISVYEQNVRMETTMVEEKSFNDLSGVSSYLNVFLARAKFG